ncbi:uncharacterized protein DNG_05761 [Cephalotrichum gorgonifer]|uniref:Nudix hydrolase domain-containing protein n=1 Tax=Cephalotrichum gorgonifer TaxID=2041049 RepID=A0AAE8MYS9_9PEZI|nr:uncharacterized protein DNG_05761 [Cephalotrichum gorgonifer]
MAAAAAAPTAPTALARGPLPSSSPLTYPAPVSPFAKSAAQYLVDNDKHFDGLAVGALVFSPTERILLVQRAAHDSMPNRWETPGGAADPEDATLLDAAARELWEESGLVARRVTRVVSEGEGRAPGQVFTNRTGSKILCRFSFEVEVEGWEGVSLDPAEHQDYVWATEEEVRAGRAEGREIVFTNRGMMALVLEGFRLRKEENGGKEEEPAGEEGERGREVLQG